MTRTETAVDRFINGMACSQAVLSAFSPSFGMEASMASRLAAGFGSGMRMGETCGAVTGAMMVLGLALCGDDSDSMAGRHDLYGVVQKLTARFTERHKTTRCSDLLGCNPGTPEGARQATEQGLFRTLCPRFVEDASLFVEELLAAGGR